MSSKRDLVEAHSFNRRRLITAFVSGAPGGREVEPIRYGRTLIGGLVLAVLLLAGAAVAGFFNPAVPDEWMSDGLVVGKKSGARFLATNDALFPVLNTTSARLLLPADQGDMKVTFVPDETIAEQKPGVTVGIAGAPDVLPPADNLLQSNWSSCVANGQVDTRISRKSTAKAQPGAGLLVQPVDSSDVYLVTGERRYLIKARHDDATLRALQLVGENPIVVPGTWLDLVTLGSPLESFTVDGAGDKVTTGVAGVDTVGVVVEVNEVHNILTDQGELLQLTDFQHLMYTSTKRDVRTISLTPGEAADLEIANESRIPTDWPLEPVSAFSDPSGIACLLLETDPTKAATVSLAAPTAEAPAVTQGVHVDNGHGAVVRASSGGVVDKGTVYLVDATGTSYPIGERGYEPSTMQQLGYADVPAVPVPLPWMDLFLSGPRLSTEAALHIVGTEK